MIEQKMKKSSKVTRQRLRTEDFMEISCGGVKEL